MDIRILKLVTGEEILGEIVNITESFTIRNPVGVAIVRGEGGQPNVGFAPFPLHAEPTPGFELDIHRSQVVYFYVPAEDFINNYNQIFGAGIVLPSKKLIMG